jgi:hypothetical protein
MKSTKNEENGKLEEHAEIVDGSVIHHFSAKIVQPTLLEITVMKLEEIAALSVANRGMSGCQAELLQTDEERNPIRP